MTSKSPTTQEQIGAVTPAKLVELLQRAFPAKTITPSMSMDQIMHDAGIQRVIDYIAECHGIATAL